ncbi:MAG: hypothetical protein QNJ53_16155 [Pleurocapsa sp. MO_192.B19]|nr:hypothetical protein [Pleurocapsa sp. MO_192.B19]
MQFDESSFNLDLDSPESWLILLIYIGFWVYSYYSLVVFLIHIRKQNRMAKNMELEDNSLEITS